MMKVLFIISTDDGETIYNAMRLANVGVEKGDEVSVFMLGKGVLFEGAGLSNSMSWDKWTNSRVIFTSEGCV